LRARALRLALKESGTSPLQKEENLGMWKNVVRKSLKIRKNLDIVEVIS
jgi:hypothetical protein